jgi:hypothetical protein
MPFTASTRYVAWTNRRGRRASGTTFTELIVPPPTPILYNGGGSESFGGGLLAPDELPVPGSTTGAKVKFAFWSLSGGADGGVVGLPNQHLCPVVNVGASNLVATAWYLPVGGGGVGESGIWIDAFDVNTGNFVLDDFVNVTSTPALTPVANNDGWLPSSSAQQVAAYPSIHFVPFMQWNVMAGSPTAAGTTLSIPIKSNGVAFAFFKSLPSATIPKIDLEFLAGWLIIFGIINDGNGIQVGPDGKPVPIGPWGGDLMQLLNHATAVITSVKLAKGEKLKALEEINAQARKLTGKMYSK